MSRRKSNESQEKIQKLLVDNVKAVNEWVGFSQRNTKITAEVFVQTLVLGWLKKKDASLNELAHSARELGVTITGSALHERIGKQAVMLLAGVLNRTLATLQKPCPLPLDQLKKFRAIYITDSSQIALPARIAPIFQGNQDNSMLKLQVTWDYLNGHLAAIEIDHGRSPDQACQLHVHHAQPGTLQLFDLGYFDQEDLRDIARQDAYFVSRYQSQTALYDPETHLKFDLAQWLQTMAGNTVDREVLLGRNAKLPVRIIARRVSQETADARRRKVKKKARGQGKTCSASYLFLQGWDIVVTNLDAHDWEPYQIFDLYAIRFQIEWLFRIWKDQIGIDEIGQWRIERIMIQLYAHLLAALLTHLLTAPYRWDQFEFSFTKTVQIIQSSVNRLMRCFALRGWGIIAWINRLERDFRSFGAKTNRRKSPSTAQLIYRWGLS